MYKNYVVKHDDFIKLTNSLTTIGQYRAINACLCLLDTESLLIEGLSYPVDVTRYATVTNIHYSRAFFEVLEILKKFKDTFFEDIIVDEKLRTLKVVWKPEIIPLISGEMEAKTFRRSKLIMEHTSSYRHYRLYEYFQKYLKTINLRGELRFFTADLREASNCIEVYPSYKEFSRSVLKPFLTTLEEFLEIKLTLKGNKREVTIMKQ